MRIIITGGTGLIGSHLAAALIEDGHDVIVLSRNPGSKADEVPGGARIYKWDSKTTEAWGDLADGADAIVNLAGAPIAADNPAKIRWTPERKEAILKSRMNAGHAVMQAIREAENKPGILIQSSAVGYYGDTGDTAVTEDAPPGSGFLADVCKQWEATTDDAEELGVRRCVIRTGIVFSMEGGAFPLIALPFRFFAGGPLGSGEQYVPWIHIADEVRAIKYLIENENASGVYNLSAPEPVKNKELARAIGKVMGRPSFMPAPAPAFKVAFGEAAQILLEGQRAIPERLIESDFEYTYAELKPALRDLL